MIHAARLDHSPALQKIVALLSDYEYHTSYEIFEKCHTICPSTRIQELKAPINGIEIESDCRGVNENSAHVWRYRLKRKEAVAA